MFLDLVATLSATLFISLAPATHIQESMLWKHSAPHGADTSPGDVDVPLKSPPRKLIHVKNRILRCAIHVSHHPPVY
ncbi:hypothetical protein BDQ12DRAFT_672712 [Crucibulum laeve]|uniref:Secreted protein n=1 Tax=Crucibulum laeve TaxID=68775 RepID=A0A5C3MGC3_9AGAR|nr:hypothetical protein BDQ12DRAFT_672712 [Crucibulum laeve]